MRKTRGFTLVELTSIMIILGIIAAVAIPRMTGGSEFRAVEFHDGTVAALRFAQKSAISHRRMVCIAFSASTVTLTIDATRTGNCNGQALALPGSNTNVLASSDPSSVVFNPVPVNFNFQPNGTGADRVLAIAGQPAIVVSGPTGYVQ